MTEHDMFCHCQECIKLKGGASDISLGSPTPTSNNTDPLDELLELHTPQKMSDYQRTELKQAIQSLINSERADEIDKYTRRYDLQPSQERYFQQRKAILKGEEIDDGVPQMS